MSTTKETMRGFLLSCLTEIAEYKYKLHENKEKEIMAVNNVRLQL